MIYNLDVQFVQFLIIISVMIIAFVFELLPMEVTAFGTVGLLLLFDIISIDNAISGFSNKAVIALPIPLELPVTNADLTVNEFPRPILNHATENFILFSILVKFRL